MRRLPVYFVLDVSESMVGEPLVQMERGMRSIISELRGDPHALETVYVSVIAFAGKAKVLVPLTELYSFYPPELPVGGGTSLGAALDLLMSDMDKNVKKTTIEVKGDWKPLVFLFTDGAPTDDPDRSVKKWNEKYRSSCTMTAFCLGDTADAWLLGRCCNDVLRLNDKEGESFSPFFKWITDSIKTTSHSIGTGLGEEVFSKSSGNFDLEKANTDNRVRVDENVAVLLGRCSETKRLYLIKYARKLKFFLGQEHPGRLKMDESTFKLVGAYAVDEEKYRAFSADGDSGISISSESLIGTPTCPCCGNQLGLVFCGGCGKIFCWGEDNAPCPWCGMQGELGESSSAFDLSRERG